MDAILINPQRPMRQFDRHLPTVHKTIFVQSQKSSNESENRKLLSDLIKEPITSNNSTKKFASLIPDSQIPKNFFPEIFFRENVLPKKKSIARTNYGSGPEIEKLKKFRHYKEPFENCAVYIALGRPAKNFFTKLGAEYNKQFELYIITGKLPKFRRDHKRNFGLAVWFFEDIYQFIYPWLKEKKFICN